MPDDSSGTDQVLPHRYADLAQRLESQIHSGGLRAGDRLPSVRELAGQFQCSISTALRAYEHLEALGLIGSRPRSGYYVQAQAATRELPQAIALPQSQPSLISSDLVSTVIDTVSRPGLMPLSYATPAPEFLPAASLNRITRNLIKQQPAQALSYLMSPGLERLRQQIAARMNAAGVEAAAEDIVITNGALEAINLCVRMLTRPGDTLLMESPTYYSLLQVAEEHGLRVVEVANDPTRGVDPEEVRRLVRRHRIDAALLAQNFNNPTGSLMPDAAKRELVQILGSAGIPLIEDDVYGELGFNGQRATPLKSFDTDDRVLYCSSFSKTLSPGMRLGWVLSRRHRRELARRKFTASCAAASLPQLLVSRYLDGGGYERHLRGMRSALARSVARFADVVLREFPAGTSVTRPQGGFVLWVQLPDRIDAMELFAQAAQGGIAISPGTLFSAAGQYQHHIRLNCALPWTPKLEQALCSLGWLAARMLRKSAAAGA
ncbi:DNA-binding transcriptional regulator, MocR family, contains an aminotransferase domain [Solimonas aquatica]|uniref:DNA-binding transcriptional regulator, MocR family, contains an aminotransferase domain n=1 Tax=Solimonas aquatica TaxID=489703 RepID=A0A1H9EL95_9GAMM|nr:PLP-dependent aminotransferase family protein [Solimonas aquatica]SEQ26419.1 DNA-binding transcriptional regulator, MocR family, contains an aminotransferase domain [Solimonas aquatica]